MKENNDNGKKEMQYLRNIWLAEKRKLKKEILNSGAIPELFKLKAVSKKDNNCIAGNCFYKSCFIL